MDCVVAPVDHVFPNGAEETSVTLCPLQIVVEPIGVIVGVAGMLLTVTTTGVEVADVHDPSHVYTVYVPEVVTVIACDVAPLDHEFPDTADEVNVTLPPVQNDVGPLAETVGAAGDAVTVTFVGAEEAEEHPPLTSFTV